MSMEYQIKRMNFIQFHLHDIRIGRNYPENCKRRVNTYTCLSYLRCSLAISIAKKEKKKRKFQSFQIEYLHWISPSVSVKCSCYDSNQVCAWFTRWLRIGFQWKRLCRKRTRTSCSYWNFHNFANFMEMHFICKWFGNGSSYKITVKWIANKKCTMHQAFARI